MAIKKSITNSIGAVMEYHKIGKINTTRHLVDVTVYSYANAGIREKEKEFFEVSENFDQYASELSVLKQRIINSESSSPGYKMTDDEKEKVKTEIAEIERKMQTVIETGNGTFPLQEKNVHLELDADEDISVGKCYEKLKELEIFAGAEDC